MKQVTINERAAATAIDYVVGPEKRMLIEQLYALLDQAEKVAHHEAFDLGYKHGHADAYDDGYHTGYSDGIDVATANAPQPDIVEPTETDGFYEVDEADEDYEQQEARLRERWVQDPATGEWIERELPAMQEQYEKAQAQQAAKNPFAWS